MKKIVFIFTFLFVLSGAVCARERNRVEFSAGPSYPLASVEGYRNIPFVVFSASYLRDMNNGRLWLGFECAADYAARKVLNPVYESSSDFESCRTMSFSVVSEYSFARKSSSEFFAGAAAGIGQRATFCPEFGTDGLYGLCVSPRVGVILWGKMKVSLEARFTNRYYDTVGLRVGFVL